MMDIDPICHLALNNILAIVAVPSAVLRRTI